MSNVAGVVCGYNKGLGMAQVCGSFFQSVKDGRLYINEDRTGWCDAEMPTRRMSWRGRYYGLPRGCEDSTGKAYVIERCPFCSGDLAPVVPAFVNQSDGSEGEE